MTDPAIHLTIGNLLILLSSAPLIRAVYRDRKALRGISTMGALLNLLAMTAFDTFYILTNNWISLCLTIPIVIFWGLAMFYSRRAIKCSA